MNDNKLLELGMLLFVTIDVKLFQGSFDILESIYSTHKVSKLTLSAIIKLWYGVIIVFIYSQPTSVLFAVRRN